MGALMPKYFVACLFLGIVMLCFNGCKPGFESRNNERTETMIERNQNEPVSMDWIDQVHKAVTAPRGVMTAVDSTGRPIRLEWEKVDAQSPRLNEIIKEASVILANTYTTMEVQFVRQHPEAAATEMFLKPVESLLKAEPVNWGAIEQALQSNLQQFFSTTDFAQYGRIGDVQIFVFAFDEQTGEQLGVINFIFTPEFKYGSVKVAFFGTNPKDANLCIDQKLMSSIFVSLPDVARIFLHTRATNTEELDTFQAWGFTPFAGPLPYWRDMEYLSARSDLLQNIAQHITR